MDDKASSEIFRDSRTECKMRRGDGRAEEEGDADEEDQWAKKEERRK